MAKVADVARTQATASFSRFSLFYTSVFALKLPLLAYLTEPLPWYVPQRSIVEWDSFDAFNNATFSYLFELYNSQTLHPDRDSHFDSSTATYVVRRKQILPLQMVPTASFSSYLIHFPGAMFYGSGMQSFVASFLNQDAADRPTTGLFHCQRNYYYSGTSSDSCIWLERLAREDDSDDVYMVYFGTVVWESTTWSWCKLAYRCLLTLYILRVFWQRYYRHFQHLLNNLRNIGIDKKYCHYEVIVGDPTYLIICDPCISIVMMADIMVNPAYCCWSTLRVSLYNDLMTFSLGCLYSTRLVWLLYHASFVVSCQGSPVGPSIRPVFTLIGNTQLMVTWDVFLPPALKYRDVDYTIGMIMGAVIMAIFPPCLAFTLGRVARLRPRLDRALEDLSSKWANFKDKLWCPCKSKSYGHSIAPDQLLQASNGRSEHSRLHLHSQRAFNDLKNRLLFAVIRC
ncbi:hypothetical protein Ae201684P_020344 [Aphanomyces euteiches]|nr:hypothetical protein Ae201684P_020344 [Aphanomyces euteiches]